MNRSSGILIFSSGYAICFLAVVCCLFTRQDARVIIQEELDAPDLRRMKSDNSEPIQYVLMNPPKQNLPFELERPPRQPNILIATLKTDHSGLHASVSESQVERVHREPNILIATLPADERGDSPVELGAKKPERPNRGPNILIATLPADDYDFFQSELNKRPSMRLKREPNILIAFLPGSDGEAPEAGFAETRSSEVYLSTFRKMRPPLSGKWAMVEELGNQLKSSPRSPFSLAGHQNNLDTNPKPSEASPFTPLGCGQPLVLQSTLDPNVMVANDFEGMSAMQRALGMLTQAGVHQTTLEAIEEEIDDLATNGSIDPALCEGTIYRIATKIQSLDASSDSDEDTCLIQFVRREVMVQINLWLDQLNGVSPKSAFQVFDDAEKLKDDSPTLGFQG